MALFEQLYNRLFKGQSDDAPIVYELLKRSEKFLQNYQLWLSDGRSKKLLDNISTSYALKKNDLMGRPDVHILSGSAANGIAISYDEDLHRDDLSFVAEYFKDQILSQGYKKANADRIIKEKGNAAETTEKYYLKPIISGQSPFNQLYGNVLIELVWIDDRPSFLKVVASTYHDTNFQTAYPFNQLINQLLNA